MNNGYHFKKCSCSREAWEMIVVDYDENYNYKRTTYFHCDDCGEDFAVLDFETEEILYLNNRAS
ncbi:MAG: hypothetical protein JST94_10675 [Bacteroidetes bacterium]|nr:hypothetical protein [Bacteroidota bacterium]MBS1671893.1 hypothetical protein [Bacteroidota bacterium]